MEVELRFDEVLSVHMALMQLIDRRFASIVMSIRVSNALRRIQPVFEDVAQQYNATIERHAKRDEEGNVLYTDETKTQIAPIDPNAMNEALEDFFAGTIQVTLPRLSSVGLALADGSLCLADVAAISVLFEGPSTASHTLSRDDIMDLSGTLNGLMGESFASSESLLKIAKTHHVIVRSVRTILTERRLIAKGTDGDAEDAVRHYMQGQVAVEFPPLSTDDFALADGGVLSPRQLYGLVPVLALGEN